MKVGTFSLLILSFVFAFECSSGESTTEESTAAPRQVFSDDFNRSDGGLGSSWALSNTAAPNSFNITTNRAYPFRGATGKEYPTAFYNEWIGPTTALTGVILAETVTVKVSISIIGGSFHDYFYLIARSGNKEDTTDAYLCGPNLDVAGQLAIMGPGNKTLVNGVSTITPLSAGSSYTLAFVLDGTSLACSITGAANETVVATHPERQAGYFGVSAVKDASTNFLYFDDFSITRGSDVEAQP